MIRKILDYLKKKRNQRYYRRVHKCLIKEAIMSHTQLTDDFLTIIEQKKSNLVKYRIKEEFIDLINFYLKERGRGFKLNIKDYYFGTKTPYIPVSLYIYSRTKNCEVTAIPESFVLNEIEQHRLEFFEKLDDKIK